MMELREAESRIFSMGVADFFESSYLIFIKEGYQYNNMNIVVASVGQSDGQGA